MKKAAREPWRMLTNIDTESMGYPSLCHFCRFARWEGDCEIADLNCTHPLDKLELWEPFEVWGGADCWAFQPDVDPDEAADLVGIWLRGEFVAVEEE